MRIMKICALIFFILLSARFCFAEGEVEKMINNLHWLGHDSFRLDAAKVIYFDPFKLPDNSPAADIILITHEHYDHYSPQDLKIISRKHTIIITNQAVSQQLKGEQVDYKEIRVLKPQEVTEVGGVKITAVPSYNTNKQYHPKSVGNLGFIVNADGVKIYQAGDTDFIPEMKDFSCDIALLPVSGTYVMTADEAAQAALIIKPKIAIPMHFGAIVGKEEDARRFQELLKGKIEVRILKQES